MWQKHLIHCNIEFHHAAFSYVTRNIWPDVRGGLGLLSCFPGAPCPLSTNGIWSSNRKEREFSAVPVKESVLHVPKVRCPLSTHFLLFSSLSTNPALISTNSHIRYCDKFSSFKHNVLSLFHSIFYSQHRTCAPDLQGAKQLITLFTEIKAGWRQAVFCRIRLHLWNLLHPSLKSRHHWDERRAGIKHK